MGEEQLTVARMVRKLGEFAAPAIAGAIYLGLAWAWGYFAGFEVHWGWLAGGALLAYVFWFVVAVMGESMIEDIVKTVMSLPLLATPALSAEGGALGLGPVAAMLSVMAMRLAASLDFWPSTSETDLGFDASQKNGVIPCPCRKNLPGLELRRLKTNSFALG